MNTLIISFLMIQSSVLSRSNKTLNSNELCNKKDECGFWCNKLCDYKERCLVDADCKSGYCNSKRCGNVRPTATSVAVLTTAFATTTTKTAPIAGTTSLTKSSMATPSVIPNPNPSSTSWASLNIENINSFGKIELDAFGSSLRSFVPDPLGGSTTVMKVTYPAKSYNPSGKPLGGTGFYAKPLNLSQADKVSFEFKVYFPLGFNFVKGGKLPGLYGGHPSCSGGNKALDCFSTRYMFRANGAGELYLYVDQSKQVPEICKIPPYSICNPSYGSSLGRGAFTFETGKWTTVRQVLTLNTPGKTDGSFEIYANGKLVSSFYQVQYRTMSSVGFVGIDFATFFGGSDSSWATPVEQYSYFKDFILSI